MNEPVETPLHPARRLASRLRNGVPSCGNPYANVPGVEVAPLIIDVFLPEFDDPGQP